MADRGDVLRLKRKLGFGKERAGERVVVVQATPLNAALPTTVVVPLDANPKSAPAQLTVKVSAHEAGADQDFFAILSHVQVTLLDRLAPGRVGRLRPSTLLRVEEKLRLVLDL
jgi:mRNA-degrading endonuclease toxin of MazEF toxin-antitoxin module